MQLLELSIKESCDEPSGVGARPNDVLCVFTSVQSNFRTAQHAAVPI